MASVADLSDGDLYERWEWEHVQDEHPPNEVLIASLEREAKNRGFNLRDVTYSLGITAARIFNPDLHPRGRDGRFIEKLGIIELFDLGGNVKDGRRGTVVDITPDPKSPGRPVIKVRVDDPNTGKTQMYVDVRPENIQQAPEAKARLNMPEREAAFTPGGTGTKEDPLRTVDPTEAAQAMGEGKYVELDQPSSASMLLEEIKRMTDEAKELGEQAPTYDLCLASVAGTNLFCAETKNIPRIRMPQLKTDNPQPGTFAATLPLDDRGEADGAEAFVDYLRSRGIDVTEDVVPADTLRPSQNELNGAKVAGIMGFIEGGGQLDGKIFVTSDDYVVDGHHRWAAQVGAGIIDESNLDIAVDRIDAPILQVLAIANNWTTANGFPHAEVAHIEGANGPDNGDTLPEAPFTAVAEANAEAVIPEADLPEGEFRDSNFYANEGEDAEYDTEYPPRTPEADEFGNTPEADAADLEALQQAEAPEPDVPQEGPRSLSEELEDQREFLNNMNDPTGEAALDTVQERLATVEADSEMGFASLDEFQEFLENQDDTEGLMALNALRERIDARETADSGPAYQDPVVTELQNAIETDVEDGVNPDEITPESLQPIVDDLLERGVSQNEIDDAMASLFPNGTATTSPVEGEPVGAPEGDDIPESDVIPGTERLDMQSELSGFQSEWDNALQERIDDGILQEDGDTDDAVQTAFSNLDHALVGGRRDEMVKAYDEAATTFDRLSEEFFEEDSQLSEDFDRMGAAMHTQRDSLTANVPDAPTGEPLLDSDNESFVPDGPEGDGRGEGLSPDDRDAQMQKYGPNGDMREDAMRDEFATDIGGDAYDEAEDDIAAEYGVEIADIYEDPEMFDALLKRLKPGAEGGTSEAGPDVEVRPTSDGMFGIFEGPTGRLFSTDENKFETEEEAQAAADKWNQNLADEREALTPIPALAEGDVKSVKARNLSYDVDDYNIEGVSDAEKAAPKRGKGQTYVVSRDGTEMQLARVTGKSGGKYFGDIGGDSHDEITPDMIIGKVSKKSPSEAPGEGAPGGSIADKMSEAGASIEGDQVVGTPGDYQGSAVKLLDGADSPIGTRVTSVKDGKSGEVVGYDKSDGYVKVKYDGDPKTYARSKRTLKAESAGVTQNSPSTMSDGLLSDEINRLEKMANRPGGLTVPEGKQLETLTNERDKRKGNAAPQISRADAAAEMFGVDSPQHKKALADEAKGGVKTTQVANPLPKSWGDPEIKKQLEETEQMFREEGVQYSVEDLMETRREQVGEEIAMAREEGGDWITLKPPSGTEQGIPLEVAEAWAAKEGIEIPKA